MINTKDKVYEFSGENKKVMFSSLMGVLILQIALCMKEKNGCIVR